MLSNYESVTNTTLLVPKRQMNDFTFLRRIESPGTGTVASVSTNLTEMTATASQGVTILATEGNVEMARQGAEGWTSLRSNTTLSVGDRLRTGTRSRATLRWPDNSVLRVNELTSVEIQQPGIHKLERPALELKEGTIYRFNRDGTTNSFRLNTPSVKAAIRG